jgi:hypothetical protein
MTETKTRTKRRTTRNVATLERNQRLAVAHAFTGSRVELTVRPRYGAEQVLRGQLLAAAVSHGGGADVAVLLQDGHTLADAYSLATVRSINEL